MISDDGGDAAASAGGEGVSSQTVLPLQQHLAVHFEGSPKSDTGGSSNYDDGSMKAFPPASRPSSPLSYPLTSGRRPRGEGSSASQAISPAAGENASSSSSRSIGGLTLAPFKRHTIAHTDGLDDAQQHRHRHSSVPMATAGGAAAAAKPSEHGDARHVFFFVNPTSGGNLAAHFVEARITYMEFSIPCSKALGYRSGILRRLGSVFSNFQYSDEAQFLRINAHVYDIRQGLSGNKPGFLALRRAAREALHRQDGKLVFVVVAGGDGTVMWCTEEIVKTNIDERMIALGVVPYGTGNDFARALGWQKMQNFVPYIREMQPMRQFLPELAAARVATHDIWEIDVCVKDTGDIQKIDNQTRKKRTLTKAEDCTPLQIFTLKMLNYFSIGVESRIGIGFERHRTKNAVLNKMRYGAEGVKKTLFKSTPHVSDTLSAMSTREGSLGEDVVFVTQPSSIKKCTESPHEPGKPSPETSCTLTPPAASLIALNLPSFASGLDLWKACSGRLGLTPPTLPSAKAAAKESLEKLKVAKQKMGDGMLEFLTFGNAFQFGAERAVGGHGRRLHQGRGPFRLSFHQNIPPSVRSYFQVDGEYFIARGLDYIKIRWLRRVNVLSHPNNALSALVLGVQQSVESSLVEPPAGGGSFCKERMVTHQQTGGMPGDG